MKPAPTEGWMAERPRGLRALHYIGTNGRSLCGKWGFGFEAGELQPDDRAGTRSPGDCIPCYRLLRKRDAKGGRA